jgi:hypothetical protein
VHTPNFNVPTQVVIDFGTWKQGVFKELPAAADGAIPAMPLCPGPIAVATPIPADGSPWSNPLFDLSPNWPELKNIAYMRARLQTKPAGANAFATVATNYSLCE